MAVAAEPLKPWSGPINVNDFRDPHLVTLTARVDEVEVRGADDFTLQRQASNTWRLASQAFPVDTALANEFVGDLGTLQIVQFKAVVTEPELAENGLTNPARQITLKSTSITGAGPTNATIARLAFGATNADKVFVSRADEDFIYAIRLADFQELKWASWQLRDRRIWSFSETNVAGLTVSQGGKEWQLIRNGPGRWSPGSGAPGTIDDVAMAAIEEIVHRLGELAATAWVDHGEQNLSRYGLRPEGYQILVELRSGEKLKVEFGGRSPSQYPYAKVALDGEAWVFEFPLALYQFAWNYLTISSGNR